MGQSSKRHTAFLLGGVLLAMGACAPERAIVRGNWPDGRLGSDARGSISYYAPPPPAPAPVEEEWLASEPSENGLSAAELNRREVLQPIHFDFDRSAVRPDQVRVMESNAAWLLEHPRARILIEGHCDERGTREYNLALGARRANSARDFLVSLGVAPTRIETVSYGEELPAAEGHNERAWALNRRAEFVIVSTDDTD